MHAYDKYYLNLAHNFLLQEIRLQDNDVEQEAQSLILVLPVA